MWSKGLDEAVRNRIRTNLEKLFFQLLPRRVYMYMKGIKYTILSEYLESKSPARGNDQKVLMKGAEDVIASGMLRLCVSSTKVTEHSRPSFSQYTHSQDVVLCNVERYRNDQGFNIWRG